MRRAFYLLVISFTALYALSCSTGGVPTGNKVGAECEVTNDCNLGLVCYKGEDYSGGYCTIMCDPLEISGTKSVDCEDQLDVNKSPSRCAYGKPDEDLGLCRPSCQSDADCKRANYHCYGYSHPLIANFRGGYCTQGGIIGSMCVRDRDCALDLTCYRDQTWECNSNDDCPDTQVCDGEFCSRNPEGFCTKPCRFLSDDITDPLWEEVLPGWSGLTTEQQTDKASQYAGQSPDCPDGSECGPSGLCRAICNSNDFCYANRYDRPCENDKDCEPGGFCATATQMYGNVTSKADTCFPECMKSKSCTGLDYECRDYQDINYCLPVIHCESTSDCRSDEICKKSDGTFVCETVPE